MWQVIGHIRAVELLKHSLETERLAHAYLLVGPPHVGKTTLATDLAQALNCEQDDPPCGECASCSRIAAGNHADVQTVTRLQDQNSGFRKDIAIGQIRELQQAAALEPYEGRQRVFIIDGAEHLNEESANCLLKTLEEPPPKVTIVLLAVDDGLLPPTVVSRCQRIDLNPLNAGLVEQSLVDRWQVDPDRARLLANLSGGCIGWAITASGDESHVQERHLALSELQHLADAGLDERFAFAAREAGRFAKNREQVEQILGLWLGWWRDLLLVRAGCPQRITNVDLVSDLEQRAQAYTMLEIREAIEAIVKARKQLDQNANPRLVLEVLMLSIPRQATLETQASGRGSQSR